MILLYEIQNFGIFFFHELYGHFEVFLPQPSVPLILLLTSEMHASIG